MKVEVSEVIKMKVEVSVWIEVQSIIDIIKEHGWSIDEAYDDYVAGLDDREYYIISSDENIKKQVTEKIKEMLDN